MGRILHVSLVNITLCDGRPVHSLVGLLESLALVREACTVNRVVTAGRRHVDSGVRYVRESKTSGLNASVSSRSSLGAGPRSCNAGYIRSFA